MELKSLLKIIKKMKRLGQIIRDSEAPERVLEVKELGKRG